MNMGWSRLCVFICSALLAEVFSLHLINPDSINDGKSAERKLELVYNDLVSKLNSTIGIQSYTEGILGSLLNDTHEDYTGIYWRWSETISKLAPTTRQEILTGELRGVALRLPANLLLLLPLKVLETIQLEDVFAIIAMNKWNLRLASRLLESVRSDKWDRDVIVEMISAQSLKYGENILEVVAGSFPSLFGNPANWTNEDCALIKSTDERLVPYIHGEMVTNMTPDCASKYLRSMAQKDLFDFLPRATAQIWLEKFLLPLSKWDQKRLSLYGRFLEVASVDQLKLLPIELVVPKKSAVKIASGINFSNVSLSRRHYWVKYLHDQTNLFGPNASKASMPDQFKRHTLNSCVSSIPLSLIPEIAVASISGYMSKIAQNPSYLAIVKYKQSILVKFPDLKRWTRERLLAFGPLMFTFSYDELNSLTVPLDFQLLTVMDSDYLLMPKRRLLVSKAWDQIAGSSHLLTATAISAIPPSYYGAISTDILASANAEALLPLMKEYKLNGAQFLPSQQVVLAQKMKLLHPQSKRALADVNLDTAENEEHEETFAEKMGKRLPSWFTHTKQDDVRQSGDFGHVKLLEDMLCVTVDTFTRAEVVDFLEIYNQLLAKNHLHFPLNLQRCLFELLMPSIEISTSNREVITGDITQMLPADFKAIGGKLLLRFKLQDFKVLKGEACVAAFKEIGSLEIVELMAQKNLRKIEGIAQLAMKCLNKTNGEIFNRWDLETLGNLAYFLPAMCVKNISPMAFKQWIFGLNINSTKAVCSNEETLKDWTSLILASFGPLAKWSEEDVGTVGGLLFITGEQVINIPQVTLQDQLSEIFGNSPAAISVPEWPTKPKSFAEVCKVLLGEDGTVYYQRVKTALGALTKVAFDAKPVPDYTCDDLIGIGKSLEMIIDTMAPQLLSGTIQNCLEYLGNLDLPLKTFGTIWNSGAAQILTLDRVLVPEEIIRLGNINLALEGEEMEKLYQLNGPGKFDALAILGQLNLNDSQVLAISSKIALEKLSARDEMHVYFSSLIRVLCGYSPENITTILRASPELLLSSLPFTSDIRECTDGVLSALVSFAINNTEFGDVTKWTESSTDLLGSLVAGLERSDLEKLPLESMNGLKPHVVTLMGKKLRFFASRQLAKMAYSSAMVVDAKQEIGLHDDQRAALNYVKLGGSRIPRNVNSDNWASSLLGITNATSSGHGLDIRIDMSGNDTVSDYDAREDLITVSTLPRSTPSDARRLICMPVLLGTLAICVRIY